jgi:hypothetical protein
VHYLAAQQITDAEWQTYAWSGGRLDPAADLYQWHNGQKFGGAAVDFDRIIHARALGAWWPASHKLNVAANGDDEVTDEDIKKIAAQVWAYALEGDLDGKATSASARAWLTGTDSRTAQLVRVLTPLPAKVDAVGQVLSASKVGMLARVATLQASVDKVSAAVTKLTPAAQVAVDTAKIATASADAVAAKIKALAWKAA